MPDAPATFECSSPGAGSGSEDGRRSVCVYCGYDRSGLGEAAVCPECGVAPLAPTPELIAWRARVGRSAGLMGRSARRALVVAVGACVLLAGLILGSAVLPTGLAGAAQALLDTLGPLLRLAIGLAVLGGVLGIVLGAWGASAPHPVREDLAGASALVRIAGVGMVGALLLRPLVLDRLRPPHAGLMAHAALVLGLFALAFALAMLGERWKRTPAAVRPAWRERVLAIGIWGVRVYALGAGGMFAYLVITRGMMGSGGSVLGTITPTHFTLPVILGVLAVLGAGVGLANVVGSRVE
ncbi:MAG: hypothetical protein ACTS3F_11850 [Phycisphaerales bacterium]